MGITASTSLARLRENKVLLQFVGQTPIAQADDFWKSLLTFSFPQPKTRWDGGGGGGGGGGGWA